MNLAAGLVVLLGLFDAVADPVIHSIATLVAATRGPTGGGATIHTPARFGADTLTFMFLFLPVQPILVCLSLAAFRLKLVRRRRLVLRVWNDTLMRGWLLVWVVLSYRVALGVIGSGARAQVWFAILFTCAFLGTAIIMARRVLQSYAMRYSNLCPQCSYSLLGNVTGVCPECGYGVGAHKEKRWRQAPRHWCIEGNTLVAIGFVWLWYAVENATLWQSIWHGLAFRIPLSIEYFAMLLTILDAWIGLKFTVVGMRTIIGSCPWDRWYRSYMIDAIVACIQITTGFAASVVILRGQIPGIYSWASVASRSAGECLPGLGLALLVGWNCRRRGN